MIPRLWKVVGSVVAVLFLGAATVQAVDLLARSVDPVDVDVRAAGIRTLVVEVEGGRVEVVGADTDRVRVRGSVTSGIISTDHRTERDGDRFVVAAGCHPVTSHCGVDLRIVVPDSIAVTVRSGDTELDLADLAGPVDARTSDSGIVAARLSGPVRLRTSDAEIEAVQLGEGPVSASTSDDPVDLAFAEPPVDLDVRTSNGSVAVVVPDTSDAYALDVDTSNGDVVTDVRTDPDGDRRIRVRTSNDDVRITSPTG